ncbi:Eco57I restriction-modification methylase domain-containing protein [Draconibacterium sediminis]|uniref:type IIG restriction enzyme/methyltransferase n=1 Tax=Draconibacterium sediminis TaxID=1544798 RepID=UPI0026F1A44B|nr:Eco57I restriction-modification methylase domain-containing protein [Draconibacterium sediminis]
MTKLNTRKALNPAYRKHKPLRKDVNSFTDELLICLKAIKEIDIKNESEEHIKEPIKTFFKNTFYKDNYINTKGNIDLAIYLGKNLSSDAGVIIETKKPSNKSEFLLNDNLNRKALHELLLYYLRERIDEQNNNIKHLIATNGYEWYLFKSEDFYRLFYKNRALVKEYEDFRDGKKDSSKNELFYNEIAKKYIAEIELELPFVYLDFTKQNIKTYSDTALNTLYKIFSDVHFLGAGFGNDSNKLNKSFYNELLHIIGLEEIKEKGKKLIQRKIADKRDYGSILENAIFTIEDRDYLNNIKSVERGENKAFNAGLDLTLTWINRILFLKLLESQLLSYHDNRKEYRFLNSEFIKGYDDLNDLFFSALAKQPEDRHPKYRERFQYIPYLNSSLFERSVLENEAFTISSLNDDDMPIYSQTVLKNTNGKRMSGNLNSLDYLFRFLDAYNFSTDGTEGIEDDNESKTLINASVLGLIFEKINGYKEGSFYTPAYITMYMSRETIRRAVVQKFRELENDQIETFNDLKAYTNHFFKTVDLKRFNEIINTIRIVDPAVGSGHFLVSALNELIAIKSELHILVDENGNSLRSEIIVENDELYITDEHGHLLDYKPGVKETALIQKTLFHEKQNLIENSLFGVDINPNSVKICRLRLWIELLKNAYYTDEGQLQTLPNIDINIKTGNSLISRFALTDDLKDAFKGNNVNYNFTDYKNAVAEYKNTNDKNRKHEVLEIINEVKDSFESSLDDKFIKQVKRAERAYNDENERLKNLKVFGQKIKKAEKDNLKKLKEKAQDALAQKEEIVNNAIYLNAFEWRFEFPEVLNEKGDYMGFDVVIGNPPYIHLEKIPETSNALRKASYETYHSQGDIYCVFVEKGIDVLKYNGLISYIMSNKWLQAGYGKPLREYFLKYRMFELIDFGDIQIFDGATTYPCIFNTQKAESQNTISVSVLNESNASDFKTGVQETAELFETSSFSGDTWVISSQKEQVFLEKLKTKFTTLSGLICGEANYGIKPGYTEAFIFDLETRNKIVANDAKSEELIHPVLRGRDIKPWFSESKDFYMLCTFPSLQLDIEEYIGVKNHLLSYGKERLEQSGKPGSRKKTANKWFETQDAIMYHEDFKKPKIMYQKFQVKPCFIYDEQGLYCNDSMWIIPTENKALLGILNSKMGWWLITKYCTQIQNGCQLIWKYFGQIPVPELCESELNVLVDKMLLLKKKEQKVTTAFTLDLKSQLNIGKLSRKIENWYELKFSDFIKELNKLISASEDKKPDESEENYLMQVFENRKADVKRLQAEISITEKEIDQMVYRLYELTEEEIKIVEGN